MRRRVVILFPGQGAQKVGMLQTYLKSPYPSVHRILNRAFAIFGQPFYDAVTQGPPTVLDTTRYSQAAMYVTGLCAAETAKSSGKLQLDDTISSIHVAGLSIGELTALTFLRMIDLDDGLRIVQARGDAMTFACSRAETSMLSVVGLQRPQIADCIRRAHAMMGPSELIDGISPGPYVANLLWPTGVAMGGTKEALKAFAHVAADAPKEPKAPRHTAAPADAQPARLRFASRDAGPGERAAATARAPRTVVRVSPLAVEGAFHTPYMAPAELTLAVALAGARVSLPCLGAFAAATTTRNLTAAGLAPTAVARHPCEPRAVGGGGSLAAGDAVAPQAAIAWFAVKAQPALLPHAAPVAAIAAGGGDSADASALVHVPDHAVVAHPQRAVSRGGSALMIAPAQSRDVSAAAVGIQWTIRAPPSVARGGGATLASGTTRRAVGARPVVDGPIHLRAAGPAMEATAHPVLPLFPPRAVERSYLAAAARTRAALPSAAASGAAARARDALLEVVRARDAAAASLARAAAPSAGGGGTVAVATPGALVTDPVADAAAVVAWAGSAEALQLLPSTVEYCDFADSAPEAVRPDGTPGGVGLLRLAASPPWLRVYANVCGSAAHYDGPLVVMDAEVAYSVALAAACHTLPPTSNGATSPFRAARPRPRGYQTARPNDAGPGEPSIVPTEASAATHTPPPAALVEAGAAARDAVIPAGGDVSAASDALAASRVPPPAAAGPFAASTLATVGLDAAGAMVGGDAFVRVPAARRVSDIFAVGESRSLTTAALAVPSALLGGQRGGAQQWLPLAASGAAAVALPPHAQRISAPLGAPHRPPPGVAPAEWLASYRDACSARGMAGLADTSVDRAAAAVLRMATAAVHEATSAAAGSADGAGAPAGREVAVTTANAVATEWSDITALVAHTLPVAPGVDLSASVTRADPKAAGIVARIGGMGAMPVGPHSERIDERGLAPMFGGAAGDIQREVVKGSVASGRRDATDDATAVAFDSTLQHIFQTHGESARTELTRALLTRQLASPVQMASVLRRAFDGFIDDTVVAEFKANASVTRGVAPDRVAEEDAADGLCNDGATRLDVFCFGDSAQLPAIVKRYVARSLRDGATRLTSVAE